MLQSRTSVILRDITAILVVAAFMFPLFWWGLTSIKPDYAIFDKDGINWFSFEPTFDNYRVTVFGQSRLSDADSQGIAVGSAGAGSYDSRQSLFDSIVVALGATLVSVGVAVFAAYSLSRMAFRGRVSYLNWVLGQRFMPPVAIVVPLVLIMLAGLRSLPKEPFEAAAIDGANAWQMFRRLTLPMMSRVIAIAVLIRGIDLFRMVDYIHVMTARGPGTATLTLPTYATQEAFTKGVFNYASTIALVTLVLIIVTSTLFMKIFRVRL